LDTLDIIFRASYSRREQKVELIKESIIKNDLAKFFLTITWECKVIDDKKYIRISKVLVEAGKMLFGWEEYLQNKNPLRQKSFGENV